MKAPTAILAPILALLGLALCAAPALADPNCEGADSATTLTVQVSGMTSARGEMAITVYGGDAKKFLAPKGKLLRVLPVETSPSLVKATYVPASFNGFSVKPLAQASTNMSAVVTM